MPLITRTFIKAALAYLCAALLLAVALAANDLWRLSGLLSALGPAYFHLFMLGWVTQLIFGVVLWMFPKYSLAAPRRSERLSWAVFGLLNAGLVLRVLAEPFNTLSPGSGWGWLLALSALLQWLAGLGFIANVWGRVKEK